jgi:hypothetical protein
VIMFCSQDKNRDLYETSNALLAALSTLFKV